MMKAAKAMAWRMDHLIDAVAMLASDPDKQLSYLSELGVLPCIDELALEFGDIEGAADAMLNDGELNTRQHALVKSLNCLLDRMSGRENARLWTADAISSLPEWKEVRTVAATCLAALRETSAELNS